MLAPRGSRRGAAYFVVTRGRKACPLPPPQHGGARSEVGLLRSLCSLRADRVAEPPTSSSLGDEKRVPSLLLSTVARDPRSDCSARYARSARIASGSRLLRRHSGTKSVSPPSSSARWRAIRGRIAPLAMLAPRGSRRGAAYFVVTRGRKACPLPPPQHGGARSEVGWLRSLRADRVGKPPLTPRRGAGRSIASRQRPARAECPSR